LVGKIEAVLYYLFDYRRPWSVPTSFLLDEQGRLAVIYTGRVDVGQLVSDIKSLSLDDPTWLKTTLPFQGHWSGEPRHPNLLAYVGTFFEQGFVDDAIRFVEKYADVLAGDPDFASLRVRLASYLRDRGQIDPAIGQVREAIRLRPDYADAYYQLARALQQSGRLKEAVRAYERVLRLDADAGEVHYSLATALLALGETERAVAQFRQAYKRQPDSLAALNGLAWALSTSDRSSPQDTGEAVGLAERAAQITHHAQPQILDTLAAAYAATGEFDQAIETATKAIALASERGSTALADEIRGRLNRYQARKPFRLSD
jgi:tetratricopeptide (TPR) repeat protein